MLDSKIKSMVLVSSEQNVYLEWIVLSLIKSCSVVLDSTVHIPQMIDVLSLTKRFTVQT